MHLSDTSSIAQHLKKHSCPTAQPVRHAGIIKYHILSIKPYLPHNNQQQKKKRICKIVDFAVPADHRIKLMECEKKDKYLYLAKEFKKL